VCRVPTTLTTNIALSWPLSPRVCPATTEGATHERLSVLPTNLATHMKHVGSTHRIVGVPIVLLPSPPKPNLTTHKPGRSTRRTVKVRHRPLLPSLPANQYYPQNVTTYKPVLPINQYHPQTRPIHKKDIVELLQEPVSEVRLTLHPAPHTPHSAPHTPQPAPHTPHYPPYALHPTPSEVRLIPYPGS